MAFLAGENITAGRLNRLQPKVYSATATATLAASSTDADITGASITLTTEANNATVMVTFFADFDLTGASTATATARCKIDGTAVGPFAEYGAEVTTDRSTSGNTFVTTIATAGSHTIKLVGTTAASQTITTQTTLSVVVTEVA